VWESRLTWSRDGQAPLVSLDSEHREAEPGDPIKYRIGWDNATRSMRFELLADRTPELSERIVDWLREHGPGTTDDVREGVGVRKSDVLRTLETLEQAGTTHRGRSGRRDQMGRPIRDKVWNLSDQAGLWPVPSDGTTHDDHHAGPGGRSPVPDLKGGTGTDQPPEQPADGPAMPPRLGDPMYPVALAEAGNGGLITEDEFSQLYALHKLIERSREGQA